MRLRWWIGLACLLSMTALASAQRVTGYNPPQITTSYQPTSNLQVTITMQDMQVPPNLPGYGMKAYWDPTPEGQGLDVSYARYGYSSGTQIPVSGVPGASVATVTVAPALRLVGQHTIGFCLVYNAGPGPIESCTDPVASARFIINPDPTITTPSPLPAASINTPYSTQLAAAGGTGSRAWSLAQGSSMPPGLTLTSGGAITGTPTQPGIFNFTAVVTDSLGVPGSKLLAISVNSGLSIVTPATLPGAQVSVTYSTTIAAAGGVPPYNFSANPSQLPPGMVLNANTGVLGGTPSVAGDYSFLVTVRDAQLNTVERTFSVRVTASVAAPTILTSSPLPEAVIGVSYPLSLVVSGGQRPFSFSVSSGALPPGLQLDSANGVLSGTPSQLGDFTFEIRVADAAQRSSTKPFTLRVVEGITITTTELPSAAVGVAYPSTSIAVTGGAEPYTFELYDNLPPGLTLNPLSGVIGGTPTQAGVFSFAIIVRDSSQRVASRDYSIGVEAGLRFRTTSPLPAGQVGVVYNQVVEVEGGTAPYQFQVVSGSLPADLTLSGAGRLQGTPGAPFDGSFTVRATDSSKPALSTQRQFSLRISAPLVISTQTLPPAILGQSYSQGIAASGGEAPYRYEVSAGALPAGLLLVESTGTLSGTPTSLGSFPFTVRLTDGDSNNVTRAFTLEVRPAPITGATVTLQTGTPPANAQQQVDVGLATPRGEAVDGTLFLEFAPSVTPAVDDPAAQFVTGGRQVSFQIPSGQTSARFGGAEQALFQTGTVAGTITIRAQLRLGSADATPTPPPTSTVVLPPLAPTLTSLAVTRTGTGLNVVVRGYSTPRNMTSATLNFTSRAGSNVTSGLSFTVNLAPAFTTWYTSSPSTAFGSQFQLTLPVTISGDATEITGLSIALSNSVGGSNSLSATF
ncbi:MAG: putative Ig domain-containing protein [Bryobacterales bacterium]|nr:putative Ig domain-containing protein [Bryobacterales bacterium]